jgi:acyl-CoA synthetase (AMP-forming)/AMP-acid ligase II
MGKGTRVGLYFTYGQEWVIAWLAASRIGALVMPLATTYRPLEIGKVLRIGDIDTLIMASTVLGKDMQQMLEDSVPGLADFAVRPGGGAQSQALFLTDTPSLRSTWVTGDTDRAWATPLDLEAEAVLPPGITDELLAQLGSEPPVFFCAFPFFWIGGTLLLGAALQTGATVLVIERFEPGAALAMIEEHQATSVTGWPSLIQAMRDDPSFSPRKLPEIAGLTMGPADVALNASPVPGIPGHRGMSETVGNIMSVQHRAIDPDTGEDQPDMAEGELLVRGYGLMHGYYKKERNEVFDDDGWLHTDDRVFIHEGRPYFVGRFTEMVKSQGANVAPREVELFLEETFPEILYAFVVGMPHPERGEEVTAVLVASQGHAIDAADVQRRSREQISGFKVPTRIEIWDEADVPWLGSGKPDKVAIKTRLEVD